MQTFKDFLILSNQQSASIFLQCEVNQTLAPFTSRTYFAMLDMLANSAWPDIENIVTYEKLYCSDGRHYLGTNVN